MAGNEQTGDVFVLDLGDSENRMNPGWLASVNASLDEVETVATPRALLTVGTGKFFSNGLDLDWMGAHPDEIEPLLDGVEALLARVLTLPVPTVAVIQGHAFGAGALLGLSHDFRLMREDRGYFCLPEVDLGLPFRPAMTALLKAKLTPQTALTAMTTGRRYGGAAAVEAGIVDQAHGESDLRAAGVALAQSLAAKAGPTLGQIKRGLYEKGG